MRVPLSRLPLDAVPERYRQSADSADEESSRKRAEVEAKKKRKEEALLAEVERAREEAKNGENVDQGEYVPGSPCLQHRL
jgi:hypothetical protein